MAGEAVSVGASYYGLTAYSSFLRPVPEKPARAERNKSECRPRRQPGPVGAHRARERDDGAVLGSAEVRPRSGHYRPLPKRPAGPGRRHPRCGLVVLPSTATKSSESLLV